MNTTPDTKPSIYNVGDAWKWKLLVGFAISIFVIIVIALVTIGIITKGSFVFEKSPSPTLAPTKAPTLAPITSPPTMAPITSQPTFSPTFAPTPSSTFAPTPSLTMAPITSPPTTLYTRYQSECYVPQISEGISNTMTAAIVRSLGGYEPPGSSNNYIFETAYGGPYIPNVRDPENAPVPVTQAPGIEGDSSIYIKLEFYKNTNMYNQFETAAADIMKQLGNDNTVMIMQIFKSLTPTAEATFGEGYIFIEFNKLSLIDFNDLILSRSDPTDEFGFSGCKVLQSLPTNTVTVLCPADSPASF